MYYFAYSSNMNLEHMRRLCGWHFTVLGAAVLSDFECGPDLRGYFNIRPKAGAKVSGVLYELDQHCIDILDEAEGYPSVFAREEIEVENNKGEKIKAWVYLQSPEKFGGAYIKESFLRMVISGAMSHRLPESWLKFLQSYLPAGQNNQEVGQQ